MNKYSDRDLELSDTDHEHKVYKTSKFSKKHKFQKKSLISYWCFSFSGRTPYCTRAGLNSFNMLFFWFLF